MNETPTQSPDQGPEQRCNCGEVVLPESLRYFGPRGQHTRVKGEVCTPKQGPERVAQPTAEQARNIEGDFEEPEYTRLKAQKDAIAERENERLRDEGRKSVVLIRCINCLSVPQQNKSEITEAECGGCIAKERDAALARIAELERDNSTLWEQLADRDKLVAQVSAERAQLERERDEARAEVKDWRAGANAEAYAHDEARTEIKTLRTQLAESEKDRKALEEAAHGLADRLKEMDAMFSAVSKCIQWGKTFLNADAIRQMNEAPLNAAKELARFDALKEGK